MLAFNSAEDLILLTKNGNLLIIDIIYKKLKQKLKLCYFKRMKDAKGLEIFKQKDQVNDIAQAKFNNSFDTLVFCSLKGEFYYLDDVKSGMHAAKALFFHDVV